MDCPFLFQDKVRIDAQVQVAPDVVVGNAQWCIIGKPKIEITSPCTYYVTQKLCVRFPVRLSVDTCAVPTGITCEPSVD